MDIAIVTDSTSDIPYELAEQHHIWIVPNTIVVNGQSLEDGKDISRTEFYERLPQWFNPPTTATASSGLFQQLYEKLFQQGSSQIISIHASSLLSGIFNAASIASQAFGGRVHVIDSGSVTLGLGFQVIEVAEAVAARGERSGIPIEPILKLLEDVGRRSRVVAMLDTLEYVRRSGRVSWARARFGDMLHIKPFVGVQDGIVVSLGEARTYHKGVTRLLEMLRELGPLQRLAVLHTNAEQEARQLLEDYHTQLTTDPLVVNITTVIGTHVGPHGLGFAAIIKGTGW